MLKGRLGLETARVPHGDRHGIVWLSRGKLTVVDGTLQFVTKGGGDLPAGKFDIPFQMVSCILLGPGSTISHDALRLLARHGTGLIATGDDGVRMYASMPFGPGDSILARRQVRAWSDAGGKRIACARQMYAWRLGEVVPSSDIAVLRGIEGSRMKETYRRLAVQFGVEWQGRRYDRSDPEGADHPNQAINHAATAVEAAAMIAVTSAGVLPQLGFIHEDSSNAFVLDIADLFRDTITLPIAFSAAREVRRNPGQTIESVTRRMAGSVLRREKVVPGMIDRIKELFRADDGGCDP